VGKRARRHRPGFDDYDDLLDAPIAHSIDLHGLTANEAEPAVRNFLATAHRKWPGRVVHIITGKGKGSGTPVLRTRIRVILQGMTALVAEYSLDVAEGGFLVRLRQ
jgi:DNA-nicking Smr family endonuclease